MGDAEKQEEMQRRLLELQVLDEQITQFKDQATMIKEQLAEIEALHEGIAELKAISNGTEILVPIGNGIFARAKISEQSELLINVGSNTIVEKSHEEAREMLAAQKKILEEYYERLKQNIIAMREQLAMVSEEIQKY